MSKKEKKILKTIMRFFEEKGYSTENVEEFAEKKQNSKKRKGHNVEKIINLKEMLSKSKEKFGEIPLFKYKTKKPGEFKIITYNEFIDDVNNLGTQLLKMGLKGKKISIISENRYEWAVAYLAISCGTGIVVPLDKLLPANEIESLIIRPGIEAIFYSDNYNEIMEDIRKRNTTDLRYYISMDLKTKSNGIYSHKELVKKGAALIKKGNKEFLDAKINNEEVSFMLFTSGTTSMSKAVMLSHKNICANLMDISSSLKIDNKDTLLSFLPLHHSFECTVGFLNVIYNGASIAYCEGLRHIATDIKDYEITAMISVPILYEAMYKKLMKKIEDKGKLQEIEMIMKLAGVLSKVGIDFKKMLFKEVHEGLGGKLRLMVSGAAALDQKAEKGFNDLGFKVMQGYGLTETSPVIASGTDFETKLGSVR